MANDNQNFFKCERNLPFDMGNCLSLDFLLKIGHNLGDPFFVLMLDLMMSFSTAAGLLDQARAQ